MARRQPVENALASPLSAAQEQAVLALASGATQGEAAERAGVARETVWHWLQHDAEFVAALNRARKEIWDASMDRMRLLAFKSTEVLANLLEHDDPRIRLIAAQTAFKAIGLQELTPKIGPIDAADIERGKRTVEQQRRLEDMINRMSENL